MRINKTQIIIISIIATIGVFVLLEANEPTPVNWFPSYSKKDKIPLGTFATYELIQKTYQIQDINQPPFEFLTDRDSLSSSSTYTFINESVHFDDAELKKVLTWVAKGNRLFVSAKNISPNLLDTLAIETNTLIDLTEITTQPVVAVVDEYLKNNTTYTYDRATEIPYFQKTDSLPTTGLGIVTLQQDSVRIKCPQLNFVQQTFGEGSILLHTFPEAFSNYFVLKDNNYQYTENLLQYIPTEQPLLWDNYYKNGKTFYTSSLYFLLTNKYLKWAYYTLLLGTVLFVLFEGKRKQRSIPIITPLKNQTIAFTRTISGMYLEQQDHTSIAQKQYTLFLAYIRNQLRIPTDSLDKETIKAIAIRSNNTVADTKKVLTYGEKLNTKYTVTQDELTQLAQLISRFKHKAS